MKRILIRVFIIFQRQKQIPQRRSYQNNFENESDSEDDSILDSDDNQEREVYFNRMQDQSVCSTKGSSSISKHRHHHKYNNQSLLSEQIPINRD